MIFPRLAMLALATAGLGACSSGGASDVPGDSGDRAPYAGIVDGEEVHAVGMEPFWNAAYSNGSLTYSTIEDQTGTTFPVERFAGRAGLALSGTLDGAAFDMTVTEGECSDGMSDRVFPLTVTLKVGDDLRNGCAWTDSRPWTGPKAT